MNGCDESLYALPGVLCRSVAKWRVQFSPTLVWLLCDQHKRHALRTGKVQPDAVTTLGWDADPPPRPSGSRQQGPKYMWPSQSRESLASRRVTK